MVAYSETPENFRGYDRLISVICRAIHSRLRLLDTYASKIANICDLKTFWPLIQLINHLFNVQKLQIFAIFEAKVSSNLKAILG